MQSNDTGRVPAVASPARGVRLVTGARLGTGHDDVLAHPGRLQMRTGTEYGMCPKPELVRPRMADSARMVNSYPWRYVRVQIAQFGHLDRVT